MNYRRVILADEMARPRTIDKTGKSAADRRIVVRLTEAQYKRLRKAAQRKRKSVSETLRELAGVA